MRQCGTCQLCCKLVPVRELQKPAGVKCRHQKFGVGCRVYREAAMPRACRLWICGWLAGADTKRPDRAHYVIDTLPDYVTDADSGTKTPVVQVWCDTAHPFAYRDPALIAYLDAKEMPAIVRFNNERGVFLVPPCRSEDRKWFETESIWKEHEHSWDEIAKVLRQ